MSASGPSGPLVHKAMFGVHRNGPCVAVIIKGQLYEGIIGRNGHFPKIPL